MSVDTRIPTGDPALAPFLEAASDEAATAALEPLLGGDTDQTIREVVRRELGGSSVGAPHQDDVVSDVKLALVRKLWSLRRGRGEPLENLIAYVARAAEHGCYSFLRARYPERSRFGNRVRYAAAHHAHISIDRDAGGLWWCRTTRAPRRAPVTGATLAFIDEPRQWLRERQIDPAQSLPLLVDDVLTAMDRPIELSRLVDALAAVLRINDAASGIRSDLGTELAIDMPDPAPMAGDVIEHREALRQTWNEIATLPPRQRAALLLNLRDPEGGAMLHMLPATGVVTLDEIAAALEITTAALNELWGRLPLDDLSIAAAMGLTRQQIINLRKSARARLSRRLHGSNS